MNPSSVNSCSCMFTCVSSSLDRISTMCLDSLFAITSLLVIIHLCNLGCIAWTIVRFLLIAAPQSKALMSLWDTWYPLSFNICDNSCNGDVAVKSPMFRFCWRETSGTFSHQITGTWAWINGITCLIYSDALWSWNPR